MSSSLLYWKETQAAFENSAGDKILESVSKLGESRVGLNFSHLYRSLDGSSIQPSIGLSAVYNFDGISNSDPEEFSLGRGDARGRLEIGIVVNKATGLSVNTSTFYDGIGVDDYVSYGGTVRVTKPLY